MSNFQSAIAVVVLLMLVKSVHAGEIELLNFWTSPGTAKSIESIQGLYESSGHQIKNFSVNGSDSAKRVLKSRVVSGNPPAAAVVKGYAIRDWDEQGVLADLSPLAHNARWNDLFPSEIYKIIKVGGDQGENIVAIPLNIRRINWLWANPEVFEKAAAVVPTSWDSFFVQADKIRSAGYIPLAHGGESWQNLMLFETVVLGVAGADVYRQFFVDLDTEAMVSPEGIEAFTTLKRLVGYLDPGYQGRDWHVATKMVTDGRAAMQITADWAQGEMLAQGKQPGEGFVCVPAPGTDGAFIYSSDTLVLFNKNQRSTKEAQNALVTETVKTELQQAFSLQMGSIPAVNNASGAQLGDCAKESIDQFNASRESQKLVPSIADGIAAPTLVKEVMEDLASELINNAADMSAEEMAQLFAEQVSFAKEN